ncbi:hypothetical protein [Nocardia sp. NPDC005978]|uniref:hypothetical protein n=1 Tax=unclassified Nocardia TaxID=2637762 RepID=UPI0033A00010
MTATYSRVKHCRMVESTGLQTLNGFRIAMWAHRNCVAGEGVSACSCSARQQLLDIARAAGWVRAEDFPMEGE